MALESYLQIEKLTKSYGDRILFEDLTLGVYQGDKIGIIARNGAGKTTLLNIISGREDYDSGNVVFRNGLRVGYLEQVPPLDSGMTVLDYATGGVPDDEDAWNAPDLARQMLTQFRIDNVDLPLGKLSGGQFKRAALARVLLSRPDMLILDEPTNHLDIWMVEWLENYLSRQKVTLLMVTHDRYFLDRVCSEIIEIDNQQIYQYKGNYSYYLEKRQERIESKSVEIERANNLYRTELDWMRRMPQARGHKARYREDAFYELEKVAKQRFNTDNVKLEVKASYIGSKIFEADHLFKSFGDLKILDDFSVIIRRTDFSLTNR